MIRERNFKVECDSGCSYTQTIESSRDVPIYCCGICGGEDIRVWELKYDAMSLAIKARLELKPLNIVDDRPNLGDWLVESKENNNA